MLVYLKLILAILSLFFIGYIPVYFLLLKNNSSSARYNSISRRFYIFFISFYAGALIISLFFIAVSLLEIKYNIWLVRSLSLIAFIFFLYCYFSGKHFNEKNKFPKNFGPAKTEKAIFIIFAALIAVNFAIVLFFAMLFPIRFWDAVSCWSLKGKAFFIDGSINTFYSEHHYGFSHLSYPLYLPLIQTWIYFWMGEINENLVKIIFPLFYCSSCFILYYYFRFKVSRILSIVFVFIFSTLPIVTDHGYIEYTNLLFSIILAIGVFNFYLSRIEVKSARKHLMISAVFFSMLALTRSEGLLYAFIFILLNLIFFIISLNGRKNFIKNLLNLAIPTGLAAAVLLPWFLLKIKLSLPLVSMEWSELLRANANTGFGAGNIFDFKRAMQAFSAEVLFSAYDSTRAILGSSYGPIWIILFILFMLNVRSHFKNYSWIFFVFIIFGFLSVFLSLAAVEDFTGSIERYMLHLFPVTYLWVISNSIPRVHYPDMGC